METSNLFSISTRQQQTPAQPEPNTPQVCKTLEEFHINFSFSLETQFQFSTHPRVCSQRVQVRENENNVYEMENTRESRSPLNTCRKIIEKKKGRNENFTCS